VVDVALECGIARQHAGDAGKFFLVRAAGRVTAELLHNRVALVRHPIMHPPYSTGVTAPAIQADRHLLLRVNLRFHVITSRMIGVRWGVTGDLNYGAEILLRALLRYGCDWARRSERNLR